MNLEKNITECAFHIKPDKHGICMEDDVANELIKHAGNIKKLDVNNKKDAIEKLKKVYNCETESCLLENDEIINALGKDTVLEQLKTRFKPEGPYDSFDWFSNSNIDDVLEQVEEKYKDKHFLHIEFQMIDFESVGSKLARTDLAEEYRKGMKCFGVVFNTDYSSGRGQHWFSIFGDFNGEGTKKSPLTIEYFNSSGDSPPSQILSWMKKTKDHINKELNMTVECLCDIKIVNQKDNHSCGSYALYFILSRLAGITYKHFIDNKIGDETMHKFRKMHLFRRPKIGKT